MGRGFSCIEWTKPTRHVELPVHEKQRRDQAFRSLTRPPQEHPVFTTAFQKDGIEGIEIDSAIPAKILELLVR
jgi:hypothetical protein